MSKTFFKTITILLTVAMLISAAGCGTTTQEEIVYVSGEDITETITHSSGSQNGDDVTVNDEGRTNVDSVASNPDPDKYNLNGATVTIAYYNSSVQGPSPSSPTYQDEVKLISDIENKYNCKLEFKPIADTMIYHSNFVTAAQAGTKFADIVKLSSAISYPAYMKSEYLTPLDNYLDLSKNIYNQTAMNQIKYNGKHYITIMSDRIYVSTGIFFNRALFAKFGVKTPEDYVKENNWTFDTFLKTCQAMTRTQNGVDYYGYALTPSAPRLFAQANGGKAVVNKDGKYVFNMTSSQYVKGIQFAYDLFNTYKVTVPKMSNATQFFKEGKAAMIQNLPSAGAEYMEKLGSANVGFTYFPKGPDSSTSVLPVTEITSYGIPSTVKNPEVIAQILYDYTYPYKWRQTLEQQYEIYFGDATSLQTAMDIGRVGMQEIQLEPLYTYISREVGWNDYGISAQTSPQAYIASIAQTAQKELDTVWDQ